MSRMKVSLLRLSCLKIMRANLVKTDRGRAIGVRVRGYVRCTASDAGHGRNAPKCCGQRKLRDAQ